MRAISISLSLIAAVWVALLASPGYTQVPAGDEAVKRILRDWELARQRQPQVRYTIAGTVEFKKDDGGSGSIRSDVERPFRATVTIDFSRRMSRIDIRHDLPSPDGFVTENGIRAHNGDAYQTWAPRESNQLGPEQAELVLARGPMREITVEPYLWPPFLAHGVVPTVAHPLHQHDLPYTHDPEDFEARGMLKHDGQSCQILRGNPVNAPLAASDEYWVDAARRGIVLRYVRYSQQKPAIRLDVRYRQAQEAWVPSEWTVTYSRKERVSRIYRLAVESYEPVPNTPESTFTLPIKPGMIVMTLNYPPRGAGFNTDYPANATYRIAADGAWRELNAVGYMTTEGVRLPPERAWWRTWWWLLAPLATVFVLLAWRIIRRRGNTAASEPNHFSVGEP